MIKPKQKPKRYTKDDKIPSQPILVVTGAWESPAQMAARTGLSLTPLCEALIRWWQAGQVVGAEIRCGHCTVPVFRMKTVYDGEKRIPSNQLSVEEFDDTSVSKPTLQGESDVQHP